jgi:hypothetical protein
MSNSDPTEGDRKEKTRPSNAYNPPALKEFGHVGALTQSGTQPGAENARMPAGSVVPMG